MRDSLLPVTEVKVRVLHHKVEFTVEFYIEICVADNLKEIEKAFIFLRNVGCCWSSEYLDAFLIVLAC